MKKHGNNYSKARTTYSQARTKNKGLRPARLTRGQKKKDRYDMLNMMGTQLSKILNFIANIHSSIKTLLSFCSQILFLGRF